MSSQAISGIGTKFARFNSESSAGTWENIAEVNNISGPSKSRETIDVTSLDSVGGYREFIASIKDGGNVTFSMNFTKAGYDLMNDDFESDILQDYRIALPDVGKTALEFEGYS